MKADSARRISRCPSSIQFSSIKFALICTQEWTILVGYRWPCRVTLRDMNKALKCDMKLFQMCTQPDISNEFWAKGEPTLTSKLVLSKRTHID